MWLLLASFKFVLRRRYANSSFEPHVREKASLLNEKSRLVSEVVPGIEKKTIAPPWIPGSVEKVR
jgi:hypothetical protein